VLPILNNPQHITNGFDLGTFFLNVSTENAAHPKKKDQLPSWYEVISLKGLYIDFVI